MKIAYLVSKYPAVSHTFILQEIQALRARGHEIGTFSVRKAKPADIIDAVAAEEARNTRHLLPANVPAYLIAFLWAFGTRPLRSIACFLTAIATFDISFWQRLRWCYYYFEAVLLAYWLVRDKFEHLHCHFGNNGSNTAWLAARIAGVPFSLTLHGIDIDEPEKFRLRQKIAEARFTVCISKFGKARMMHLCPPKDWHKIRVVRCGLPTPRREGVPPITGQGRLLCVARLSREKGHLILFDALKQLHDEGLAFTCTLVGDGPVRAILEARVAALGLDRQVVFRGSLPPAEVAKSYEAADAVVLASFGEGIPLVLMEAMSAGRPVVATRVGGIPELVEHGENGYLCAPGNAKDLAAALARLLRHPDRAQELGEAAVKTIAERFNVDASADKHCALFHD